MRFADGPLGVLTRHPGVPLPARLLCLTFDIRVSLEADLAVDLIAICFQRLNLLLVFGPCVAYAGVYSSKNNCRPILCFATKVLSHENGAVLK